MKQHTGNTRLQLWPKQNSYNTIPSFIFIFFISFIYILPAFTFAQPYKLLTNEKGLPNAYLGNGVAAADYNNDGFIDIYFVSKIPTNPSQSGSANSLFRNNGDGTFTNVAKKAGVEGIIDNSTIQSNQLVENYGASWGDFDNDGDVDLYLTNKGMDEFYENLGNGTFKNITKQAGLDRLIRDSSSAAWFDLDNDGYLDLHISCYGKYGEEVSSDNIMYRNNGDGTFTNITDETGLGEPGWTYTTLVVDANFDGWPDLYCVNDFGRNVFYLNNGEGVFHEATKEYGLENIGQGMGATLGDYDNDGLFDIYFTCISDHIDLEWSPLVRHTSEGLYKDVSRTSGTAITHWSWGCQFLDYDLDGYLDLYVVNGFGGDEKYNNFLFRNKGDGTFDDISSQSGANGLPEARGVCVADFNNDGLPDMVVANQKTIAHLYMNHGNPGNYLKINLVGTKSNRDARGAVVSVTGGKNTYYRLNDDILFYGQSKVPLHFGLGDDTIVDILVKWPSGLKEEFSTVPANQELTITEGVGIKKTVYSEVVRGDDEVSLGNQLLGSEPNAMLTSTLIHFQLVSTARVTIELYDLKEELIATPVEKYFSAGEHKVFWGGTDKNGNPIPPGIYILRFLTGDYTAQSKLLKLENL